MVINRNNKGEIIDLTKITLSKELSEEIFRIKREEVKHATTNGA